MQKEFDAVKLSLSCPSAMSPFDLEKKTVVYCDASRLNGMVYILLQEDHDAKKYLISTGSSRFSKSQQSYLTTELEWAAACWAVRKCKC